MHIPIEEAIHLLHECEHGCLASHSTAMPGYPFATVLPFVPDAEHRPLFLISRLAEHTKNLLADSRASFLVFRGGDDVQQAPRLTLVGDVSEAEDPSALERYLRYQPAAERYVQLGDFALFALRPRRMRLVAGFGRMGWVGEAASEAVPRIGPGAEARAIEAAGGRGVLGVDAWGVDLGEAGGRRRLRFTAAADETGIEARARAALGN